MARQVRVECADFAKEVQSASVVKAKCKKKACFWQYGVIKSTRLRTFSLRLLVLRTRWPVTYEKGVEKTRREPLWQLFP